MSIPGIIRFIGACIYTGGLVLMWWVVRALGKNWSMFLEIRREQELIITGPYALVRHPMYLAFYFLVFGQWLMTANWFIGIFGVASWCLLYFARIDHEERMMVQQFGEWYSRYIRVTNRLWPLRCQKRLTQ
jgi:protein-S-isoprenylcysteine O-methyltransferase Ste14